MSHRITKSCVVTEKVQFVAVIASEGRGARGAEH